MIEVADSSIDRDRKDKASLYAAAGIPEYWRVNVPRREIEVRSEPVDGGYGRLATHRSGDRVFSAAFPDVELEVSDIVPAPG